MATTPRGLDYPTSSDLIKDGSSASALADDFASLASSADSAITAGVEESKNYAIGQYSGLPSRVAYLETTKWYRGILPSHVDGPLDPGAYFVGTSSWASTNGLPFGAAGVFEEMPTGNFGRLQKWSTFGAGSRPNQEWKREKMGTGAWTAWSQSNAALPLKRALVGSDVLVDLEPGTYWITSYSIAQALQANNPGFPSPASGDLIVWPGAYKRIEWITTGLSSRPNEKWQTEKRGDDTWNDWWRTDARAVVPPAVEGATASSGSGFKVVPLSVTLDGNGGGSSTIRTAREERLPVKWHAPITRFRVHIRNWNARTDEVFPGALSMTGLWFGEHAGAGNFTALPTQLEGAFTTPADGSDWVSSWQNISITPDTEYLINFGFTAATGQQFYYHNGQSYASELPSNAGQLNHGALGNAKAILDVWIEAETYATTPVIGTIGSSSSAGTGADMPQLENVASLVASKLKALPVHYGGPGDTMANASNFGWERWTRWEHLAKPDALINFMGSNDTFESGMTLATYQARYATLTEYLEGHITKNIYLTTITPRNGVTGAQEDLRRSINTWMKALVDARDVFDFVAAVSSDDETILPAYDSGDGYHFNTAGHTALADAVNRPITTPPVAYVAI